MLSSSRRRVRLAVNFPVISFTFDDFPRSSLSLGGAILEEHGLAATYYAALGLMNSDDPDVGRIFSEEDLRGAHGRGHELGCHTFDHWHAWNTQPKAFEASILRNRQALNRILPGVSFLTHAYPLGIPRPQTKQIVAKYFSCCRGCSQKTNSGITDLNFLRAFFLEQSRGDIAIVKAMIDKNCVCGGWLVFATHDVAENPGRFGCTPGFFREVVRQAVASRATILPVAAALKKLLPFES